MNKLKLSEVQKQVTNPDCSVWVSASAGTGKTFVLTLRVLRLLLAGVKPENILCLTYTKAAAAEMRSRIIERLRQWAVMNEGELTDELLALDCVDINKARRLFAEVMESDGGIKIQTIHGFCQSVLTRFPLEAELPPHFEVIEEQQAFGLMQQAKLNLFRNYNLPENVRDLRNIALEGLQNLALMRGEDDVVKLAMEIASKRSRLSAWVEHHGSEIAAIASIREFLGVAPDETEDSITAELQCAEASKLEMFARVAAVLEEYGTPKRDRDLALKLRCYIDSDHHADDFTDIFLSKKQLRSDWLKNNPLKKNFPEGLAFIINEAERVYQIWQRMTALRCAMVSENIVTLALAVIEIYRHLKIQSGQVDYTDLLEAAHKLITSGKSLWVLYRLDSAIQHLLIDEAQDTSQLQWEIVYALIQDFFSGDSSNEKRRSLFVVGDYKQSIFGFQGAVPEQFLAMGRHLSEMAMAAEHKWIEKKLYTSFRSSAAVIDLVDAVFADSAASSGVSDDEIKHLLHRNGHAGAVELWPLISNDKPEIMDSWQIDDYQEPDNNSMAMAIFVAQKIKSWLDDKRHLPAKGRPVRAGDIIILVKQRTAFVWLLRRELRKHGVPLAGADRLVLQNDIAAEDMLALADWLLLPEDDMTLATVLKSPIFGLNEEDLFLLCHNRNSKTLWEAVRADLNYKTIADILSGWLALADNIMPYELFHQIIYGHKINEAFVVRLGLAAEEVLVEFLNMCLLYERQYPASLQGFVRWMRMSEAEIKRDQSAKCNEVRVMTVHSAKGLQAPIVILPDAASKMGSKNKLYWVDDNAGAPLLWVPSKEFENELISKIKDDASRLNEAEQRRLMYVALTRAEDELYVGGWCHQNRSRAETGSWYEYVNAAMEKIGVKENDSLIHRIVQKAEVTAAKSYEHIDCIERPEWFYLPVPPEAASRKIKPAGNENEKYVGADDSARAYGTLEHKLLQSLPTIKRSDWSAAAVAIAGNEASDDDLKKILARIASLIDNPELAFIFAAGSMAEVPVAGVVDGNFINGQIDRLIIRPDKVIIIDFKTSKMVPSSEAEIPLSYKKQMKFYAELVGRIYKNHNIETALLWTAVGRLMYFTNLDAIRSDG